MVVLWLCLAALEDAMEKKGDVEQVYKEALQKCEGHAELSYSTARYYLEQVCKRQSHDYDSYESSFYSVASIFFCFCKLLGVNAKTSLTINRPEKISIFHIT